MSPTRAALASPTATPVPTAGAVDQVDVRWLAVLGRLDERRAAAWRLGRPGLLASVYTADSEVLQVDGERLRSYLRRGLRVTGVRMGFTAVAVTQHAPGRVTLLVVDRLDDAQVVAADGRRESLPHDRATRHRIQLSLTGRHWRIAAISLAR